MSPAKKASVPTGRHLAEFVPLTGAEEELRRACREGDPAVIGDGTRPETAPDDDEDRIRAAVLRVFCLGLDPDAPVHEHGIQLFGAWIDGDLDLHGCDLPRPIGVGNSVFDGDVVLWDATTKQLNLGGTRCKAIAADRLRCDGGVYLRDGFVATREVRLLGATIGGSLDCRKGRFEASEDDVLSCDRAKIAGSVFLNGGFVAKREVRLLGVTIGGDLSCRSGTFEGDTPLDLEKAEITGSLLLDGGFRASGVIDFEDLSADCLVDDEAGWTPNKLRLDGFTYRRFAGDAPVDAAARLRWLDCQLTDDLTHDFRPQPWEQCAKVLAEMGHERDARVLRIEKRRRMRWLEWHRVKTAGSRDALRRALLVWITRRRKKRCGALTRRILAARAGFHAGRVAAKFAKLPAVFGDFILDLTTGYGRRPMKAVAGLLGLWTLAGVGYATLPPGVMAPADALVYFAPSIPAECRADWITWQPPPRPDDLSRRAAEAPASGLALDHTVGPPYPPEWSAICPHRVPSEYSTFSPFAYALDVLLPIVDLRQEKDWSPRVTDASGEVIGRFWPTAPYQWLRDWGIGYVARLLEWGLILMGWGLSALLLGAVTGVIRRD